MVSILCILRMVRATKTSTDAPAKVAAPKAAKKVAEPKAAAKTAAPKATKKVAEPKVEAAPVPAEAPAIEAAPIANQVVEETSGFQQKLTEFSAKLQQIGSIFSSMKGDFKTLEKVIMREHKAALKSSAKRAKRACNRAPSGFEKPTRISDELAQFLGEEVGTEMARTVVSKQINNYIRENKLQRPDNGRFILADTKLATLLKVTDADELSYFNLQRFMKPHFITSEDSAAATA